ncbi:DMT family transporter [Novosphingobium rosa]|uniref:DMT family transporter n=1 Tax=Novosphingobium rosa TaxID=76978 RepID=UPI00082B7CE9|nr:SMR family transporter [Novosphingobium rosa]
MRLQSLLLILLSVSLSAIAQLLLKLGVTKVKQGSALSAGMAYATSPQIIGGFALYGLGAFVWLYVLSRLPLSAAYPFVGIGFVLTMAFGVLVLGESLSAMRLIGTALIAVGCVCVARSVA